MKKKRMVNGMVILVLLVGALAAYLLGWMSPKQPWPQATGWDRIDDALRPEVRSETLAGGPEVFWLGHSAMVLKWGGATLLLDPNTNDRITVSRRILEPAVPVSDLGRIDAALISHAHFDHMDMPTLHALSDLGEIVVPLGSEVFFDEEEWSGQSFKPLALGASHTVGPVRITAVPAAHCGNRHHPLRSKYLAVGYIIEKDGTTVYYAGDTARHLDFTRIRDGWHPDIAILPIGAYWPRIPLKWHHMTPEEAAAAAREVGASLVIPCHFGTYTLSLDRPQAALPRFARAADAAQLNWIMPTFLCRTITLARVP